MVALCPFYRWGNKILRNLSRTTSGIARIWTQIHVSPNPVPFPPPSKTPQVGVVIDAFTEQVQLKLNLNIFEMTEQTGYLFLGVKWGKEKRGAPDVSVGMARWRAWEAQVMKHSRNEGEKCKFCEAWQTAGHLRNFSWFSETSALRGRGKAMAKMMLGRC